MQGFWRASKGRSRTRNSAKVHIFSFGNGLWSLCDSLPLSHSRDMNGTENPCKLCIHSAAIKVNKGELVVDDLWRR